MAVGLLAKCYRVRSEGLILGPKEQNQKISGSSLTIEMTIWGFLTIRPVFPNLPPMIRIKYGILWR
jgi:hypothetical protein